MATLIDENGKETTITPANGKNFKLEEMQAAVHGFIEPLYLPDGRVVLCNEDGKMLQLKVNIKGTQLGIQAGIAHSDFVVGPVLVCSKEEFADDEDEDA